MQTSNDMDKKEIFDTANFLADYACALVAVGSYSARVHKCVTRIANSWGYDVSMSILLVNVTITLIDKNDYNKRRTFVKTIKHEGTNLRKLSDLSTLSWEVADNGLKLDKTRKLFEVISIQSKSNFFFDLILTSIAFGAFCKLWGGDIWGVVFVIIGTFFGYSVKNLLGKLKLDVRIIYIICAFISSYIVYLGYKSGLSLTPAEMLSSSILYLVPGIVLINAIFDILNQNTLIGIARLINVTILFLCMAIGIYLTLSISGVVIAGV
ncbi:MAG: threonine/serine exporter family protein [Campylobacter sp.]|nr:threonine/serine exporter family protein [Campylobacter sp.]